MENSGPAIDAESPCQACGACCSYSQNWPRFTIEDDAQLDLIPEQGIVTREQFQRPAPQPVDPRVSDVPDGDSIVIKHGHRHGRSHTLIRRVGLRCLINRFIGAFYALFNS